MPIIRHRKQYDFDADDEYDSFDYGTADELASAIKKSAQMGVKELSKIIKCYKDPKTPGCEFYKAVGTAAKTGYKVARQTAEELERCKDPRYADSDFCKASKFVGQVGKDVAQKVSKKVGDVAKKVETKIDTYAQNLTKKLAEERARMEMMQDIEPSAPSMDKGRKKKSKKKSNKRKSNKRSYKKKSTRKSRDGCGCGM